ncbi:MAG: hypothetical protein HWN65_20200 [Candidatus Helarchaeota archaeon]|nr:hypothetical protein [Candidatus Helarchaeota archaeon]
MTNIAAIRKFATQVINADGLQIGTPVILEEISFVPIIKQEIPREERDYLTLSEACSENSCLIIDKGTEVNHIIFQNNCEFPILIEEGEIFLGKGTQDRICIGIVMVQPGEKIEVPVKCVHAPHHLSSGAAFGYGGKCSRVMLNEMRAMKRGHAVHRAAVSTISQARVWQNVAQETIEEEEVADQTQYTQAVKARQKRAKQRSEKLQFPSSTIGIIVIDPDGNVKGLEIHRSPHNFQVRKDGILESLETNVSWKKSGKGSYFKAQETVKTLFKNLSKIKEGKDALKQVEVDGIVLNMAGIAGEVLTSKFYSAHCPECGTAKPRKKVCPHCGFEEEVSEVMAFMSMA